MQFNKTFYKEFGILQIIVLDRSIIQKLFESEWYKGRTDQSIIRLKCVRKQIYVEVTTNQLLSVAK